MVEDLFLLSFPLLGYLYNYNSLLLACLSGGGVVISSGFNALSFPFLAVDDWLSLCDTFVKVFAFVVKVKPFVTYIIPNITCTICLSYSCFLMYSDMAL